MVGELGWVLLLLVAAIDSEVMREAIRANDQYEQSLQLDRELRIATGWSKAHFEKFKVTLKNLNSIGELKFKGEIRGDPLPRVTLNGSKTEYSPNLFEGDLLLTQDQMDEVMVSALEDVGLGVSDLPEGLKQRKKRQLTSNTSQRWTTQIPYRVSTAPRSAVQLGIREWESKTCLRFRETAGASDYIDFIAGSGCFSNVGRIGGRQTVSIGFGCTKNGIVAHEIGHALGFWHTQSRPDREQYITVAEQNIASGTLGNFLKRAFRETSLMGIPYDLGSVMHYSSLAFSINNQPTIRTRNPLYQTTPGQREQLSFYDVKHINLAYCSNTCRTRLPCKHNGYADPNDCSKCRCPEGFGGRLCDKAAQTASRCGQIDLRASSQWQTISMRGPGKCYWSIKAAPGALVSFSFPNFGFIGGRSLCSTKYVEVKYDKDLANTGPRFCTTHPRQNFLSEQNEILVVYWGDDISSVTLRYRQQGSGVGPLPTTPRPFTTPWSTRRPFITTRRPFITTRRPFITTRRPFSTTRRPFVTPAPISFRWSQWAPWTRCSAVCGGCGTSNRRRFCALGGCVGPTVQRRCCNFKICSGETKCCEPYINTGLGYCDIVQGRGTPAPATTQPPNIPTSIGPPVVTQPPTGGWSVWSAFGPCQGERKCGGCGTQFARRTCLSPPCSGAAVKRQACGFQPCTDCGGDRGRIIGWVACPDNSQKLCPLREKDDSEPCPCCDPFQLTAGGGVCR